MGRKRLTVAQRKTIILDAAVKCVEQYGDMGLTHGNVAKWASMSVETSESTVRRYFGSWDELATATTGHPNCPKSFRDYVTRLGQ